MRWGQKLGIGRKTVYKIDPRIKILPGIWCGVFQIKIQIKIHFLKKYII